jgi:hypothetical protein
MGKMREPTGLDAPGNKRDSRILKGLETILRKRKLLYWQQLISLAADV